VIALGFREQIRNVAASIVSRTQDKLESTLETHSGETLQQQINLVAATAKKNHPLRACRQNLADSSVPLQNNVLKANAALTLFANPRTTILIERFITPTENKLIEKSGTADGRKKLAVWNEKTKSRDTYEEIYTEKGSEGCAQFTSFYDVTNRRISINYAGTIFTDINDLQSAAQVAAESVSKRMTRVKDSVDKMVSAFNKLYPGQIANTPIDIYAHSAGACSIPLTNYFLQRTYGLVPHAQIMIDPFGAKNSFEKVSEMIALAEGRNSKEILAELIPNTVTFKPAHPSIINSFRNLNLIKPSLGNSPETIGQVKTADVGGNSFSAHQIRTWVKYFNNAEMAEASANNNNHPPKKPNGMQPDI